MVYLPTQKKKIDWNNFFLVKYFLTALLISARCQLHEGQIIHIV